MESLGFLVIACVLGYLLGAFPSAYLIGRLNGINIFAVGSGNMGATNVLRALGTRWAIIVFLMDALKGGIAVVIARALPGDLTLNSILGAVAAVIGHNWSLFVSLLTGKLRGGKGAATAGGTWVALFAPWAHLILVPLLVMFAVVWRTRYVSLGVLVTVAVGALIAFAMVGTATLPAVYLVYVALIMALIYYRHRENIQRLREGRERRIGDPA